MSLNPLLSNQQNACTFDYLSGLYAIVNIMLTQLKVLQYTIVDEMELEFTPGLSIISGETGAGKSVLIDALNLTLGGRTDLKAIRQKADRTEVFAHFDCHNNTKVMAWLSARDLDPSEGCLLRRTVSKEGRSRAYINGLPCTAQDLKNLGQLLVNIHGQHEHQHLLQKETQRELLDQYGSLIALCDEVDSIYQQWRASQDQLTRLQSSADEQQAKADLLTYQLKEIHSLNLAEGEMEQLESEHKRINQLDQLQSACQEVLNKLSENEQFNGLANTYQSLALLEPYATDHPPLASAKELIAQAGILLEESISEISHFQETLNISPEEVQIIEDRLTACMVIAQKHRVKANQLHALQHTLAEELNQIGSLEERLALLEAEVSGHYERYMSRAKQLSQKRKKTAKKLNQLISEKISLLGMPGGKLEIQFTPRTAPHRQGLEQIEFYVSTNPGQPLQPMNKIVSGGELSRISLAIQVILAEKADIPTLFFDEVDVGVGGAIAEMIGKTLRELGSKAQIICVTHLPQVAAQGHQHFSVKKQQTEHSTTTAFTALNKKQRVIEIARMLGGLELTNQTVAHAKEMLKLNS